MKTIAVILPYAVSIRDFVHSGTLNVLSSDDRFELVIYTLNPDIPELRQLRSQGVAIRGFKPYSDHLLERIFKWIYLLFFYDVFARVRQSQQNRRLRRLFAGICCRFRRFIGTPNLLRGMCVVLLVIIKVRGMQRQLPSGLSLLIGTRSLMNSIDYGLMAEAMLDRIPVLAVAGSWDNFTTKGYFPFPVHKTVVWNEKMKEELVHYFGSRPDKIDIAGYPRASVLRSRVLTEDSAAYLRRIGIEGFKRFVLYSASYAELTRIAEQSMPIEYMLIKKVSQQLAASLPTDVCILIRLHPFARAEDKNYFSGNDRYFVFLPGRQDSYVERVMNDDDECHLATQLAKSECVLSMASTISIDALCLERPIMNIDFDPIEGLPMEHSIRRFYEQNHFRDLLRITRIPLASSYQQILHFVLQCLEGNYCSPTDYDSFRRMYVPDLSSQYPLLIRTAVEEVLYGAQPAAGGGRL